VKGRVLLDRGAAADDVFFNHFRWLSIPCYSQEVDVAPNFDR
jgi:hypothetical protein